MLPRLFHYPNNPTGVSYREEELSALAEIILRHCPETVEAIHRLDDWAAG